MSHKPHKHIPYCLNCHYPLAEFDSFCPNCGQKPTDGKTTMHDLVHEFVHTLFHLDGKFFSTLRHIFIPGKLTEEFFKGHHKRYAHPIQLFLVLGAFFIIVMGKVTHEAEEKLQQELDASQELRRANRYLNSVDSSVRQLSVYKNNPSVKRAFDSLILVERIKKNSRSFGNLSDKFNDTRKALYDNKTMLDMVDKPHVKDSLGSRLYSQKGNLLIQAENLASDSSEIVHNYAIINQLSEADAEKRLDSLFRVELEDDRDGDEPIWGTPQYDSVNQERYVKRIISEAKQSDSSSGITVSFVNGFRVGFAESRRKRNQLKTKTTDNQLREQDTGSILGVRIANDDILDLSSEEIIKKYNVQGYWKTRFVKRTIEFRQKGGDMLHAFFGKFLWINTFAILPTALFMYWMYRRQKRYFVEHVVWLLHYNCLTFILFGLFLIPQYAGDFATDILTALFFLATLIVPFLALKRYYKQSWVKTIVKGVIFQMVYATIGLFVFIIGGLISFLFL